jgi:hypothetical protein
LPAPRPNFNCTTIDIIAIISEIIDPCGGNQ